MAKIGVGVIGVGAFGELHVQTYKSIPGVEVVAVSDVREGRRQDVAAKYGIPHAYSDAQELCAHPGIDMVSIAVPEALHVEPVLAAAAAGKHILLEKPIATTLEDAARIMEAASRAGVYLMVGHVLRFDAYHGTLRREIEQGNLGKIVSIHARRNRPRKLYLPYARTHAILENSIHDIDLCRWYTGDRVVTVRAYTRNIQGGENPDINWSFLEFAGGAVACLETHWLIPDAAGIMTNDAMQVIGTRAVADLHLVPAGLNFWREQGAESANVSYDAFFGGKIWGAIKEELAYFVDCVRTNQEPVVLTPQDGFEAMRVALALIESARERRDVFILP